MNWMPGIIFIVLFVIASFAVDPEQDQDAEVEARTYLEYLNNDMAKRANDVAMAEWEYATHLTNDTLKRKLAVSSEYAKERKKHWLETIKFPWTTFKDPDIKRQFKKYSILGSAVLPEEKRARLEVVVSEMESIYSKQKLCEFGDRKKCNLSLEPELTEIFATSNNSNELKYYWEEWRNSVGRSVRDLFKEYVILSNEVAKLNNFTNNADFWIDDFEEPVEQFEEEIAHLWSQLQPLYKQLHAYVRKKLVAVYGENVISRTGPIPAHLLGNMWAQSWNNIYNLTVPYPGKQSVDVTPQMKQQGYTPMKMFKLSEEFFTSLNLSAMTESFWKKSIIEKPTGQDIICHASAWDFYDGEDFRIKQCTEVNMDELLTVHHEMGHIQYYLQYRHLPLIYREGANSGFHEAVGDVMALSVRTAKHLRKIGLLSDQLEEDPQADINNLFNTGLDKIAFLPFGYIMDLWRWGVFKGTITPENYNCQWWKLRLEFQGLEPPVNRLEKDFDPGCKYHTIADVPYIRYFVSFVIQFQFHRALCIKAGQYDPANPTRQPLHECDIYQSTEAGNLLGQMLRMGSSKPWPLAMEAITGQRKMDAGPLLEYFQPLQKWLEEDNAKTGELIGWKASDKPCSSANRLISSRLLNSLISVILMHAIIIIIQ
uniref:Angiotensin-converting enzyme n=1 Tax=Clastoptera arizonana TaxID=38151 RepID=A0A1B6C745_9HEMI